MNPECQLYITSLDKSGADIINLNAWYTGRWILRKVSITDFELVMNSKWGGNQYHDMIDILRFFHEFYVHTQSHLAHGDVYSIQYYVIKFVSDLLQAGGFLRVLRFPPPIWLTATI
jgi:hypothetical protein